jgi:hypothetical protein
MAEDTDPDAPDNTHVLPTAAGTDEMLPEHSESSSQENDEPESVIVAPDDQSSPAETFDDIDGEIGDSDDNVHQNRDDESKSGESA